jgi:hypothetical protein
LSFTDQEKLNFVLRICTEIAEKDKLLPLYDLWCMKYDVSSNDLNEAIRLIGPVETKNKADGKQTSYMDIELALKPTFNKDKVSRILGILYADQERHIVQLLDGFLSLPPELGQMIAKVRTEYA